MTNFSPSDPGVVTDSGAPSFRKARFSWFRCPRCGLSTYHATSRSIFSKQVPRVVVEYQCARCHRVARLRNAGFTHVAVPVAIGLGMVYAAYQVPLQMTPWYSPTSMAVLIALTLAEMALSLLVARLIRRFECLEVTAD